MKEIQIPSWVDFKDICITKKKLNIQCVKSKSDRDYHIFAVEGRIYWFINLVIPEDIKDFEKNYYKNSNKRITPID